MSDAAVRGRTGSGDFTPRTPRRPYRNRTPSPSSEEDSVDELEGETEDSSPDPGEEGGSTSTILLSSTTVTDSDAGTSQIPDDITPIDSSTTWTLTTSAGQEDEDGYVTTPMSAVTEPSASIASGSSGVSVSDYGPKKKKNNKKTQTMSGSEITDENDDTDDGSDDSGDDVTYPTVEDTTGSEEVLPQQLEGMFEPKSEHSEYDTIMPGLFKTNYHNKTKISTNGFGQANCINKPNNLGHKFLLNKFPNLHKILKPITFFGGSVAFFPTGSQPIISSILTSSKSDVGKS